MFVTLPDVSREKTITIIENDIPRTFPHLGIFKPNEGAYYESICSILESFTVMRPDVGYVQGMSYVAAILLLYLDEYGAFTVFSNLVTKYPIMPFYTFNEV